MDNQVQLGKTKDNEKKTSILADIEKQESPQAETRIVTVLYNSCCGCGCDTYEYKREVPIDSPLQNGDSIDTVLDGDEYIG